MTFAPRGILQIDNARITFKNFKGEGGPYNREGDRNFAVIIPDQDVVDALRQEGWNVKIKPPREEGEDSFMYLPVKVKFNANGPHVYIRSGRAVNKIEEDEIGVVDDLSISYVNLDIRPYDWDINGKTGRTAYLQSMEIIQNIDRFAARYAEEESPTE